MILWNRFSSGAKLWFSKGRRGNGGNRRTCQALGAEPCPGAGRGGVSSMPSRGEGGRGAARALALHAPAEPLLPRAAERGAGSGGQRGGGGFRPYRHGACLRLAPSRVAGKGLGQRKKKATVAGLLGWEEEGEGQAVGLEGGCGGGHGSWAVPVRGQSSCLVDGKAARRVEVGGGVGNLREGFSRGSDEPFGTSASLSNVCPRRSKGKSPGG